ncbi:MAG TPA: DMT family transporter [Rhodanobacteraceae bacterium]
MPVRSKSVANPSRSTRIAWIGVGLLTLIWGFNWIASKVATHDSGPFTFSAHRYIVGTLVLFLILAWRRTDLKPTPWLPTIAIGLTQTAAFQALIQWALMSGGAGKTALLAYTMPFWVVPLAWWWVHEKPGLRHWLCIAVAVAGFICVVEPWKPLGAPRSILMAVLSGLAWAAATVLSKRLFQRHPEITPLRLTAWQMLIGTVALVILALTTHERAVDWTRAYIGAVLYTGILGSGVAWVLWAVVVQRLAANVAGLTSLAVPVAVVLFGWGLLGNRPSGMEGVGVVLIAIALLALNLWSRHAAARPSPPEPTARHADAPH